MIINVSEAAMELQRRRKARANLLNFIEFIKKDYIASYFSHKVCEGLDTFIDDVLDKKRPILVLQAPPQHGKTEIVSRCFPAYMMGKLEGIRIGAASYAASLASSISQDVRRLLADDNYIRLFPVNKKKNKFAFNRAMEFTSPNNSTYIGAGIGMGLTGRSLDIGIIDDPIKNAKESLSQTVKEGIWQWYQSVFKTRLSENSGQVIIATRWAEDDLIGRIIEQYEDSGRLKLLTFPALNNADDPNYNECLPEGALCPELHSIKQLYEIKKELSNYFWSALYQQNPRPLGGNVFQDGCIRYWTSDNIPTKFDRVVMSWDCTFKDATDADFVVGQVWAKKDRNVYLLDQVRGRYGFTDTVEAIKNLMNTWPRAKTIYIEDAANGPAVIDVLKRNVTANIVAIKPDGSKIARAHAVTSFWEAGNVFIPKLGSVPWVRWFIDEVTTFPAAAHDDQVDAMTQALRQLLSKGQKIKIAKQALKRALI
jgi:predicted phage terminase large subunit-like protein